MFEKKKEETETEREFKTDTALQPRAAAPASRAVSPLFPSPCTGFLLSASKLGACAAADRTGKSGEECASDGGSCGTAVGSCLAIHSDPHSHSKALLQQCTPKIERGREVKELKDKIQVYIKELLCQRCQHQQQHVEMQRQRLDHEEVLEEREHYMRKQLTERGEDIEKLRKSAREQTAASERRVRALEEELVLVQQVVEGLVTERADLAAQLGQVQSQQQATQEENDTLREQLAAQLGQAAPTHSAATEGAAAATDGRAAAEPSPETMLALEQKLAAVQAERATLQGAKEALAQQVAQLEDAARATDVAASQQQLQELQQEMRSMRQETAKQQADLQEQNACLAACAQAEEPRAEHLSKELQEAATKSNEDSRQRTQGQPSYHRLSSSLGSLNSLIEPFWTLIEP
jgi:chromosome segregation ATPase